jgi:hypothetical protein
MAAVMIPTLPRTGDAAPERPDYRSHARASPRRPSRTAAHPSEDRCADQDPDRVDRCYLPAMADGPTPAPCPYARPAIVARQSVGAVLGSLSSDPPGSIWRSDEGR